MVKKVKHFRYDVNRKALNKMKKKKSKVDEDILKSSWDDHKSIQQNLNEMGLMFDSNKIMSLDGKMNTSKDTTAIVEALQVKSKLVGPKKEMILSEPDRKLCMHFLSNYGDNTKKMVKDPKNIYQLSAGQIGQLLAKFRATRHYQEYLTKQRDGATAASDSDSDDE